MSLFQRVFSALNDAQVRYVVVGGLAVVLQGHLRLTPDADVVLDRDPDSAGKGEEALKKLSLAAQASGDFFSPENPLFSLRLFARDPISFEELWTRSDAVDLAGMSVRLASIDDLIAMKRAVARPEDGNLRYWLARPPAERVAAGRRLRRCNYRRLNHRELPRIRRVVSIHKAES